MNERNTTPHGTNPEANAAASKNRSPPDVSATAERLALRIQALTLLALALGFALYHLQEAQTDGYGHGLCVSPHDPSCVFGHGLDSLAWVLAGLIPFVILSGNFAYVFRRTGGSQ